MSALSSQPKNMPQGSRPPAMLVVPVETKSEGDAVLPPQKMCATESPYLQQSLDNTQPYVPHNPQPPQVPFLPEHMSIGSVPSAHALAYECSELGRKFETLENAVKMESSECNTRLDEHHQFLSELLMMYQQASSSFRELEMSISLLGQGTIKLDGRIGALEERLLVKKGNRPWFTGCGLPHTPSSSVGEENYTAIHNQLKLLLESERQVWKEQAEAHEELHKRELQEFRETFTKELTESFTREAENRYQEINKLQSRLEVVNHNIEGRGLQIDELTRCLQAVSHESTERSPRRDELQRCMQDGEARSEEENMKPDQEEGSKAETSEFSQRYHESRNSYNSLVKELSTAPKFDAHVEGFKSAGAKLGCTTAENTSGKKLGGRKDSRVRWMDVLQTTMGEVRE